MEQKLGVEHMEAVANFPTLIEKAVLGETHPHTHDRGVSTTSRFYSAMRLGGETYVVKITAIETPGKAVGQAYIESVERVYDLSMAKKMPGNNISAGSQPPAERSGIERRVPGTDVNISPGATPVNSGRLSLFHVLDGLKDSADKKTPLFRPKNSQ